MGYSMLHIFFAFRLLTFYFFPAACAFNVEADRSRGRFEILESQRDTLLTALKSVAPELASQFERGELHTANPNGTSLRSQLDSFTAQRRETDQNTIIRAPERPTNGEHHTIDVSQRDLGPMVPDLEDGRPRYYGGSSSLRTFNEIDSRPSSPGGSTAKQLGSRAQTLETEVEPFASLANKSSKGSLDAVTGKSRFAVLPPPMPLFPSNSIGWVREVRRKTLVAIGRDDLFASEGW